MKLQRTISTWGLVFAALGGMIGSGWLFGPYFAAKVAGPSAIFSWALGGILMVVVAMTFAELASSFPMAGGTIRFLDLSHGTLVSFAIAWIAWLASSAVAPIETMALLEYAANYFPWLTHKAHAADVLSVAGIAVAAGLMMVMCIINLVGVKLLEKTNNTIVVIKLVIPSLTIFALIAASFHASNFTSAGFAPYGGKGILAALPTAGVIFSFIGYSPAIQLAGEARNPQRSIPIAIIGGLFISILLFMLLQIVFIGALKPADFIGGWHTLSFRGDAGPFVGLAFQLGLVWLTSILFFGAVVSPFGTALIYTGSTARMSYAMGENGYFPRLMMRLNRFGVPGRMLLINYLIGLILLFPFPTWQKLVAFLVSCLVFAYAVGPLALIVLRDALPNQHRPFRVPAAKWTCLFAFFICNLIIYWSGWNVVYKLLIAVGIGYACLMFYRFTNNGKKLNFEWSRSWWIILYLLLLGLISYFGSFGGGRALLPFGWDFLVIAVISWGVFELAYRAGMIGATNLREQ